MTKQRKGYKKLDRDKAITGYLFTLPSFIGFIIFVLIPLIWAANISLHQYNVFTGEGTFVGLKNYKSVFADARSIVALKILFGMPYSVHCLIPSQAYYWQWQLMINYLRKYQYFSERYISSRH